MEDFNLAREEKHFADMQRLTEYADKHHPEIALCFGLALADDFKTAGRIILIQSMQIFLENYVAEEQQERVAKNMLRQILFAQKEY